MNTHKWLGVLMLISVLGGCATRKPNLVDQGVISLEVIKPEKVRISYVDIDREGEGMQVSGRIVRRGTIIPSNFSGHMDVTVIGLDSIVLAKIGTPYFPRRVPRKRGGYSKFKVSIPIDPVPGTLVRVELHRAFEINPDEHDAL